MAGCTNQEVARAVKTPMENVIALGYVENLLPCYATCDVIVLPSFHEGLPYSLLEGAAAAKPLVGSDIPGIDSIITNHQNGLLVAPDNPSALADALIFLYDNPDLLKRMGRASRQYIKEYFDRKVAGKELIKYYNRIGIKACEM